MNLTMKNRIHGATCRWSRWASVLVLALALAACSDSPTGVETGRTAVAIETEIDQLQMTSLGQTVTFAARAVNTAGEEVTGAELIWRSGSPGVLVHETGSTFRTVANGMAVVTVEVAGTSLEATIEVEVSQESAALVVEMDEGILWAVGEERAVVARTVDAEGHEMALDLPVTWSSANEEVLVVGSDGGLVATGHGTTTLSAEMGGHVGHLEVEVRSRIQLQSCTEAEPMVCTHLDLDVTIKP